MFRQDFKNNLKNEIMRDEKTFSNMFNFIKIVIDFDDKLYKRAIKKIQLILKKSKNLL